MLVTICERLKDVRTELQAVHGHWIVSLDPADEAVRWHGYARLVVAAPAARLGGVAVLLGGGFAPDPLRIGVDPPPDWHGAARIRRDQLPAVVHVDTIAGVVRVIRTRTPPLPPVPDMPTVRAAFDDAFGGRRSPGKSEGRLPDGEE